MREQKICIVGDGLAGLITAITLRNLNIHVDLYYKKENFSEHKTRDNRVTAISKNNLEFLNKQIGSINKVLFWPSKEIKFFYENKGKYLNKRYKQLIKEMKRRGFNPDPNRIFPTDIFKKN